MIVQKNDNKSNNFRSRGKMIFIGIFICIIIIIAVVFFINKNTKKSGNSNGNGNGNDKTGSCIAIKSDDFCKDKWSSHGIGQPCAGGTHTQSQCSSSSYGCCEWKLN